MHGSLLARIESPLSNNKRICLQPTLEKGYTQHNKILVVNALFQLVFEYSIRYV